MAIPNQYPEEFKKETVNLILSSGRPISDVARSLGISESTVGGWVRKHKDSKRRAEDPNALPLEELAELKRLRKEVAQLKTDLEIMRLATAFFARETTR